MLHSLRTVSGHQSPMYDIEKGPPIACARASSVTLKTVKEIKKRKKVTCFRGCFTLLLLVIVFFGALFGIAQIVSKPGHDQKSQDTKSQSTRDRIQSTRQTMPTLSAQIKSGNMTKQELVDYIQLAAAFSAASYTVAHTPQNCNYPVRAKLRKPLKSSIAHGYVARDDEAQLLVVAFKGLNRGKEILQGLDTKFVPLDICTSNATSPDVQVQHGIHEMYKSLEMDLLRTIEHEVKTAAAYTILVTGHNLGGSIAVLGGLMLKSRFPQHLVLVVTQGQARTFNEAAVQHIDAVFPANEYSLIRATHSIDGIVNVGAPFVNRHARHHSGEVWHFKDSAVPDNVVICSGREDQQCSASYKMAPFEIIPPSLPWSAESLHYFDVEMNSIKSVQCGGPGGLGVFKLLTSRKPLGRFPPAEVIARTSRF